MTTKIADAIGTVKDLVEGETVSTVGATLFVHKHCTDEEIEAIQVELLPQRVERIDDRRTVIDL